MHSYDGDVAHDVAEKFGLIYAGGLLGIRYKALPWDGKDLLSAVTKAYRGARDSSPDATGLASAVFQLMIETSLIVAMGVPPRKAIEPVPVCTVNTLPQFANALHRAGRQSQHLETEDNAGTALLYMRFGSSSISRAANALGIALLLSLLALANEVIE